MQKTRRSVVSRQNPAATIKTQQFKRQHRYYRYPHVGGKLLGRGAFGEYHAPPWPCKPFGETQEQADADQNHGIKMFKTEKKAKEELQAILAIKDAFHEKQKAVMQTETQEIQSYLFRNSSFDTYFSSPVAYHYNGKDEYICPLTPVAYLIKYKNAEGDCEKIPQEVTTSLDPAYILNVWPRQLVNAMATMHFCHFTHLDIKPLNILRYAGGQVLKLTDFGLAAPFHEFIRDFQVPKYYIYYPTYYAFLNPISDIVELSTTFAKNINIQNVTKSVFNEFVSTLTAPHPNDHVYARIKYKHDEWKPFLSFYKGLTESILGRERLQSLYNHALKESYIDLKIIDPKKLKTIPRNELQTKQELVYELALAEIRVFMETLSPTTATETQTVDRNTNINHLMLLNIYLKQRVDMYSVAISLMSMCKNMLTNSETSTQDRANFYADWISPLVVAPDDAVISEYATYLKNTPTSDISALPLVYFLLRDSKRFPKYRTYLQLEARISGTPKPSANTDANTNGFETDFLHKSALEEYGLEPNNNNLREHVLKPAIAMLREYIDTLKSHDSSSPTPHGSHPSIETTTDPVERNKAMFHTIVTNAIQGLILRFTKTSQSYRRGEQHIVNKEDYDKVATEVGTKTFNLVKVAEAQLQQMEENPEQYFRTDYWIKLLDNKLTIALTWKSAIDVTKEPWTQQGGGQGQGQGQRQKKGTTRRRQFGNTTTRYQRRKRQRQRQ